MNKPAVHLSDDEIARYCARQMAVAELLAADNHLAHCDACLARIEESQWFADNLPLASQAFNAALDHEVVHLTYEQLVSLTDERLDDPDREIAESHLQFCAQCEAELQDLREVAIRMALPAAASRMPARPLSFGERLAALWRMPAFRLPALAAAALVGLAGLALLVALPFRRENAALQAQVAELMRSNQSLREQADSMQKEVAALREENDRLLQSPPVEALVAVNDGGSRITLDRQGNLAGIRAAPRDEQSIKAALQTGRVKVPASLAALRGASGTLMGQPVQRGLRLLAPVATISETDRPVFRWSALDGADSYTVTLFDVDLNQVATSGPLATTEWRAPDRLERGKTYIWQVRAVKGGQETVAPAAGAARVKFKVLEHAQAEAVERARKAYAGSHLLMGLIYADAGLLADAEREFGDLLKANPQSSVVRTLLHRVRAAAR